MVQPPSVQVSRDVFGVVPCTAQTTHLAVQGGCSAVAVGWPVCLWGRLIGVVGLGVGV